MYLDRKNHHIITITFYTWNSWSLGWIRSRACWPSHPIAASKWKEGDLSDTYKLLDVEWKKEMKECKQKEPIVGAASEQFYFILFYFFKDPSRFSFYGNSLTNGWIFHFSFSDLSFVEANPGSKTSWYSFIFYFQHTSWIFGKGGLIPIKFWATFFFLLMGPFHFSCYARPRLRQRYPCFQPLLPAF